MDDDVERREKLMEGVYWVRYAALMESIRRGERLAFERWGKVVDGVMPRGDVAEAREMEQLRLGLEALWVGFGE